MLDILLTLILPGFIIADKETIRTVDDNGIFFSPIINQSFDYFRKDKTDEG